MAHGGSKPDVYCGPSLNILNMSGNFGAPGYARESGDFHGLSRGLQVV